jgi:hypothetical protein
VAQRRIRPLAKRMEVVNRGAVMGWLENDEKREFEMFITDDGIRISRQ